jgi:hypothetical protein
MADIPCHAVAPTVDCLRRVGHRGNRHSKGGRYLLLGYSWRNRLSLDMRL